jgi:hypothetical protein
MSAIKYSVCELILEGQTDVERFEKQSAEKHILTQER